MSALISESYLTQQRWMHQHKGQYGGVQPAAMLPFILELIERHNVTEVIDYGAGKGHLGALLYRADYRGDYVPYDPAVADWDEHPEPGQMVVCIDVLEHIEPELLNNVLDDLAALTQVVGFLVVNLRPAKKHLPDGRNAHLIIESPAWWRERIAARFVITAEAESHAKDDGKPLGHVFMVTPK